MPDIKHLLLHHKNYLIFGFSILLLLLITIIAVPKWHVVELFGPYDTSTPIEELGPDIKSFPVELPYLQHNGGAKFYSIRGSLQLSWFSPRVYNITPDDRLTRLAINKRVVDLSEFSAESLEDFNNGIKIDLSEYLHSGSNEVVCEFQNYSGDFGVSISNSFWDWRLVVCVVLWSVALMGVALLCLRIARKSWLHSCLYLLVIIGAVIQVWCVFTYNPVHHIWSDAQRHWEQGIDVLRLDLMSMTDPIGYQLYIGVLAKLTLKIPALVAFYTSALALFASWIWYRFLRELQSNKTLALAGWAFFSLLPSWTAIYSYFMQETLMIPLLGAALWASWRCRRKADLNSFLIMVVLWVMVGLTRGITIPMAAVVCTWLWLAQDHRLKKAIYSSLILLFIMGPLTYRAYVGVHHFAPHGMGHLVGIYAKSGKKEISITVHREGAVWGYGFGSPATGTKPFEPFSDWHTQRTGVVRIDIDLDKGKEDWDRELAELDTSFKDYVWIIKENLIFLFFANSWPDNNHSRAVDVANSVMRFIWAPLFIFMIVGLLVCRKKLRGQWMLPSVIAVWFLIQGLTPMSLNEGRYRKPFEGLVVAQLILLLAAIRGATKPAAPSTPLIDLARNLFDRHRAKAVVIDKGE